jgi:hypothetical protein
MKLQRLAGNRAVVELVANPRTMVVQRAQQGQSQFGPWSPVDLLGLPRFWRVAIDNAVQNRPHGWQFGQPLSATAQYSAVPAGTRWFTFSQDEYGVIEGSSIQKPVSSEDAQARGDSLGTVNPAAGTNNCGYCVLAFFLGNLADSVKTDATLMEIAEHPDHVDLDQIYKYLKQKGKNLGDVVKFPSKQHVKASAKAGVNLANPFWAVLGFPIHLVILRASKEGQYVSIQILDEQTNDEFDLDEIPQSSFDMFAVWDGPSS